MRRSLWFLPLLLSILAAPLLGAGLPPAISGLSVSPDGGKVLVSMDTDGVPNAYALPVTGGAPVQLTKSTKDPVWVVTYFPADERFLYRGGPAGDEDHLFVRELDGKATELFPGKSCHFMGWSGDGRALLAEVDDRVSESREIYRIATDGYAKALLDRSSSLFSLLAAVSPDGRYRAYAEDSGELTRNTRVHDVQTGEDRITLINEGPRVNIPLSFSPDSTGLLLLNDMDGEFRTLKRFETATGKVTDLIQKSWDVLDALYSPDGKRLAVIAGGDTRSTLELYDAATLARIDLPDLPFTGTVTAAAFSRDGRELALLASGTTTPPGVWIYDLAKKGAPRRLAGGEEGGWVPGAVTLFNSFDGRTIAGVLYKPLQAAPDRKVPAIVWLHDGPGGQSRLEFDPLAQTLVQRGYAVYQINQRGSFGYGKTFQSLDERLHGLQDLQDCFTAKTMLTATGWVDPDRIAIGGTGFGGFLTLISLAFHPQEFAAGVDLFGISNWKRVLQSVPHGSSEQAILAEEMGHPADLQAGRLMVPHDHAAEIVRPLLLVQGGRDELAIPAEAADIAAAMKKNGRVVEELLLPGEAHGTVLRADREKVCQAVADFLDRNLKAGAAK